jgi:aminoglycoside phosphotransferase (APT) family kinase protein
MAEFDPADNIGTIPVQEKHRFDLKKLQYFMESNVVGFNGKLTVEEFAGGQSNPTYLLNAGGQQYVMRRKPPGILLK